MQSQTRQSELISLLWRSAVILLFIKAAAKTEEEEEEEEEEEFGLLHHKRGNVKTPFYIQTHSKVSYFLCKVTHKEGCQLK